MLNLSAIQKFKKHVNHPILFTFYLWWSLPACFWAGVRVVSADEEKCVVKIPYKRLSKNPFGSIYFACLAMAAELSTGVLSLMAIQGLNPGISMLVVHLESEYYKKAVGITYFTCENGKALFNAVEEAIHTKKGVTFQAESLGRNEQGEVVAKFLITWSFKQKQG